MKQAKPRPTKQARLVVDADAAAEPHPVLPQPLLWDQAACRLLSLLTTWRTWMRSTIPSQSELCLSRLVFSLRVIVLILSVFILAVLGASSDDEEGGTETKVKPPFFCPFLLVSGCCFLFKIASLLFSGWLDPFFILLTLDPGTVCFLFCFFSCFQSHSLHQVRPIYPLIYLARAD